MVKEDPEKKIKLEENIMKIKWMKMIKWNSDM